MSYIDFLPLELRNIIASYYILDAANAANDPKAYIETLEIFNITDFKLLYNFIFPEYYEVTLDELQYLRLLLLSDNDIYLNLLTFIPNILRSEYKFSYLSDSYFNVIYRYKVKQQFPGLYKLMKNFDLSKGGVINAINYILLSEEDYHAWKGLFFRLNHISKSDHLTETLLNFRDTGELPINYIYDSTEEILSYDGKIIYLFYVMTFHPNFKFELQPLIQVYFLLLSSYWNNEDVHIKLRGIIPDRVYKNMLNDPEVINEIEDISNEDIPLIEYIKKRAN